MDNFIRTKLEENQFTSLVNAISSGGGGGGGSPITEIAHFENAIESSLYDINRWNLLSGSFSFNIAIKKQYFINLILYGVDATNDSIVNVRVLLDGTELPNRMSRETITTKTGNWCYCNMCLLQELENGTHTLTIEAQPISGTGVVNGWNATIKG